MLALTGLDTDDPADVLASGRALPVWRAMVAAQGGDPDAPIPTAPEIEIVRAHRSGILTRLDARAIGNCAWRLGAGRARKEASGLGLGRRRLPGQAGERVTEGAVLLELHVDDPARLAGARAALDGAYEIGDDPPPVRPLVLDRIG